MLLLWKPFRLWTYRVLYDAFQAPPEYRRD